ncbi:MAG: GTP 3',8-cyclase MoaA [Candidatus Latescibacterota bacterium]|nr:GTP 3',8-cyclase MoaA [Candidatus Latescibacterota bacterium]
MSSSDTLTRPLHDLRISVTDRCNFRCPYCMPAEIFGERYEFLPRQEILTFEEIERIARVCTDLGVSKVRVTGGEPLLRREIESLIQSLSAIPGVADLTLTTNGSLLSDKASALKAAGLHRITISLDSIDQKIFRLMAGRDETPDVVLDALKKADQAGLSPIKVNAVVIQGVNDHTFVDLARYFHGSGHIVRFIEYMDVGNRNDWQLNHVVPADEIISRINDVLPLEPIDANYAGEVASRYRYKDGGGEIGVIASVTQPFCGDCTRLRLSTDGKLFTCLFASSGTDLRDFLRKGASDQDLRQRIESVWSKRNDRYSEIRTDKTSMGHLKKVEMYQIGG